MGTEGREKSCRTPQRGTHYVPRVQPVSLLRSVSSTTKPRCQPHGTPACENGSSPRYRTLSFRSSRRFCGVGLPGRGSACPTCRNSRVRCHRGPRSCSVATLKWWCAIYGPTGDDVSNSVLNTRYSLTTLSNGFHVQTPDRGGAPPFCGARLASCPNAINRKYIDAWLKDFWVRAGWDEHDSSTWTEAYNKWPRHREVPVTEFCPKAWAKM